MTIMMLKYLITRNQNNPKCPFIVLMSATFDPQSFLDYFNVPMDTNFIWCTGETAGFDEIWDWNQGRTVNNFPQSAAVVVERIVTENPDDDPSQADILIFMPGKSEFMQTAQWLEKLNKQLAEAGKKVMSILQIDATAVQNRNRDYHWTMYVPVSEHTVIIGGKKYTPSRRVIICTNVAETGLTLDNLKYVIDGGFNREIEFNPVYGIRGLITKPAPKSRIRQRRGRAGRKFRGVFYPLYPRHIYDMLPDLQLPQILIEDISVIMLNIINEQLRAKSLGGDHDPQFSPQDIDMIDDPTPDSTSACMEKLYSLGFIAPNAPKWSPDTAEIIAGEPGSKSRFGLTKIGAIARNFSMIKPECIRMILGAYVWRCSVLDMITIAAYITLDAKSFLGRPAEDTASNIPPPKVHINWISVYKMGLPGHFPSANMLYKMRLLLADDFINGIVLFSAIKRVIEGSDSNAIIGLQKWCRQNDISYRACLEFIRVRDDIIEQMLLMGMEIFDQEEQSIANTTEDSFMDIVTRVKYCIYEGFRNNMIVRQGAVYRTLMGLEIPPPKLFQENEEKIAEQNQYGFILSVLPTYILYNELGLKYNRKTSMFEVTIDRICALDGFVSIDKSFTN